MSKSPRWKSPIHMPRWASRITLEVVSVRVERVQEIIKPSLCKPIEGAAPMADWTAALADIWAEGLRTFHSNPRLILQDFADAWDRLNAKRGYPWASNPWVWVISFARLHGRREM